MKQNELFGFVWIILCRNIKLGKQQHADYLHYI